MRLRASVIGAFGAVAIAAAVLFALSATASKTMAQDPPSVYFNSSSYSSDGNGQFHTIIKLDSEWDMTAYGFDVPYDHDLLEVVANSPTSCLNGWSGIMYQMNYNNEMISIGCLTFPPPDLMDPGTGITLLDVTFHCKASGTGSLSLENVVIADADYNDLGASVGSDASFTCN